MKNQLDEMAGYHITVVAHLIENRYNKELTKLDLTISQARVLYLLKHRSDSLQSELQRLLYIQASTMNGIIDSMQKKELITKKNSLEDRRSKLISLTEKGYNLETKLMEEIGHMDEELLSGFSIEEQQLLIMWLKRLKGNLENYNRN
ncbi:MarR family transcriptional regulator [Evansella sp. AB-P1]|uniref:MarR family winged helix-turn-helix transcriptional regulator n=1 Tax=Evansella sp. AB-P1 TaxID=3037653 RepID=UPI00241F0B63|nr:MarR family transcriptional regulator [Evansella sp. AB-P1]MDG5787998.1 MarR family transcriptional regulator [Evansella sp. AB-P1]